MANTKKTGPKMPGGSNKITSLPGSSFGSLGVDSRVVKGTADGSRMALASSTPGNNNNSGMDERPSAGVDNYGSGSEKQGTVGSRENMTPGMGPAPNKGSIARAAGGNKLPKLNSPYPSNARADGTAAASGPAGRGGSMGMAARGLNGGGGTVPKAKGASNRGSGRSMEAAQRGLKGSQD